MKLALFMTALFCGQLAASQLTHEYSNPEHMNSLSALAQQLPVQLAQLTQFVEHTQSTSCESQDSKDNKDNKDNKAAQSTEIPFRLIHNKFVCYESIQDIEKHAPDIAAYFNGAILKGVQYPLDSCCDFRGPLSSFMLLSRAYNIFGYMFWIETILTSGMDPRICLPWFEQFLEQWRPYLNAEAMMTAGVNIANNPMAQHKMATLDTAIRHCWRLTFRLHGKNHGDIFSDLPEQQKFRLYCWIRIVETFIDAINRELAPHEPATKYLAIISVLEDLGFPRSVASITTSYYFMPVEMRQKLNQLKAELERILKNIQAEIPNYQPPK